MVLGVSMTSTGGNALVGTAISAGLLPPLVNAGMLISFSWAYGTQEQKVGLILFLVVLTAMLALIVLFYTSFLSVSTFYSIFLLLHLQTTFYELGVYSVLFYFTHVVTIVIVANFIFYLKDIDPRFRDGKWCCVCLA
jgi:uncharacterized membrane protein